MIKPPAGPQEARDPRERSLFDLVRELANQSSDLVRQEIALARAEIRQNLKNLAKHAGQVAIGGGVALVGALVFVVFLIVGLGVLLGGVYWLSTLLVALLLLGGGGLMAFLGAKSFGKGGIVPEATLESLAVTREWAGEEIGGLRAAVFGSGDGAGPHRSLPRDRGFGTPLPPRGGGSAVPDADRGARARRRSGSAGRGGDGNDGDAPSGAAQPGGRERLPTSAPLYRRVLHEFQDDDVPGQAAKVAFFMFSSLPPMLLVLFSLTGLIGGERVAEFLTEQMEGALPGSAEDPDSAAGFLSAFVNQVVYDAAPGPLSIGLLLGIWAGSAVFVALTEALNLAYDVQEDRSWLKRRALGIGALVGFLLLFLGGSLALLTGPFVADLLPFGEVGMMAWSIAQWPLAFILVAGAFLLTYLILPNRSPRPPLGTLAKSSAIAVALWLVATIGFRFYISNFGTYSETYGFVGAILVLLLWMWITAIVILLGGEISSEMEREA